MNLRRVRAIFGCSQIETPLVIARGWAMYNGMNADKVTYAGANPGLPTFYTALTDLVTAHQAVGTRVVGAAAVRNVKRAVVWGMMESERLVIQALADANPGHAVALIQNGGLLVLQFTPHSKALLTLTNGHVSGTVDCEVNVRLIMAASAKPNQSKTFNWEYTLDGSKTFIGLPSTPHGQTSILGLTPATMVGVRVSVTTKTEGVGPWSNVVSIMVK